MGNCPEIKLNLKVLSFHVNSQQNDGPFSFCKICHKCILFCRHFSISQISSTCVFTWRYDREEDTKKA